MSVTRENPLSLSGLTTALDSFFQKRFSGRSFWVIGEVSSHKYYDKKDWHFFDLIEKAKGQDRLVAKMSAVAWSPGAKRISVFQQETGQTLVDGLEVLLKVEVSFHQQYGLKLTVLDIDASFTLGQLFRRRQEIIQQLLRKYPSVITKTDEGYITLNKRQALPMILKRIAVVTSQGAAGFEDFLHSLQENSFGYSFSLDMYYSRVQGEEAAKTLVRRVLEIGASDDDYDLIVVIRGGGAQTDLLVFDDYILNREIARCEVPIWVGIGHHRDETIADLFSHRSLKTPTKVAEEILLHNRKAEELLAHRWAELKECTEDQMKTERYTLQRWSSVFTSIVPQRMRVLREDITMNNLRLQKEVVRRIGKERASLHQASHSLLSGARSRTKSSQKELKDFSLQIGRASFRVLDRESDRLPDIQLRLARVAKRLVLQKTERLQHLKEKAALLDPENQLKRGYALLAKDGKVLRDAGQLAKGDEFTVLTHKTELDVRVNDLRKRKTDKDQ